MDITATFSAVLFLMLFSCAGKAQVTSSVLGASAY